MILKPSRQCCEPREEGGFSIANVHSQNGASDCVGAIANGSTIELITPKTSSPEPIPTRLLKAAFPARAFCMEPACVSHAWKTSQHGRVCRYHVWSLRSYLERGTHRHYCGNRT
jgi:hypothetical protein